MWYMPAPASSASRRAMSAIVVRRNVARRDSTPSSQMPPASSPSCADLAVERLDHLEHGDLVGRAGERVAALHSAMTDQEPGATQGREELLEELDRDPAPLGDLPDRHRALAGARQFRQRHHRVT